MKSSQRSRLARAHARVLAPLACLIGIALAPSAYAADIITVYVVDQGNHRMKRFTPDGTFNRVQCFARDGTFLTGIGDEGIEPGEFIIPHAMAFDSQGALYIVDASNQRVQKFAVP